MNPTTGQTTMRIYASENEQYKSEPTEDQTKAGVVPLDSLPAAWWNWLWNKVTSNNNAILQSVVDLRTEIGNVLTNAGLTANALITNQLAQAIIIIHQRTPFFDGQSQPVPGSVISSAARNSVSVDLQTGQMTVNALSDWASQSSVKTVIENLINGGTSTIADLEQDISDLNQKTGTLSNLTTTDKSNLVAAINEVDSHADSNATAISAEATARQNADNSLSQAISAEATARQNADGILSNLTTTDKSNLVAAINEVNAKATEDIAIDVNCGTTCVCTLNNGSTLTLSANAFNENATISTDTYPGACCTGTSNYVVTTMVCCACHAKTIDRTAIGDNHDWHIPLTCANTTDTCTSYAVSCGRPLTYNPATGVLTTCCVRASNRGIIGTPTACTSTVTGIPGINLCSTSSISCMTFYGNTPYINLNVDNANAEYTHRLRANDGYLRVIATNATGCTAATQTANFDFCSNGTLKATCFDGNATCFGGCTFAQAKADIAGSVETTPYTCINDVNSGAQNILMTSSTGPLGIVNASTGTNACPLTFNPATGVLTANCFCGSAQKIDLNSTSCNATYNMPLIASCCVFYSSACPITYNPATGVLTACAFCGSAQKVCRNAVTSDASCHLALLAGDSSADNTCIYVSAKCPLTFNPATGVLGACEFIVCSNTASLAVVSKDGTALGKGATAVINDVYVGTTAIGYEALACCASTAIGDYAKATSVGGIAIGGKSCSCAYAAIAIGEGANVFASGAVALGSSSRAACNYAIAIGWIACSCNNSAIAIGYCACANGSCDLAIGHLALTNGNSSNLAVFKDIRYSGFRETTFCIPGSATESDVYLVLDRMFCLNKCCHNVWPAYGIDGCSGCFYNKICSGRWGAGQQCCFFSLGSHTFTQGCTGTVGCDMFVTVIAPVKS